MRSHASHSHSEMSSHWNCDGCDAMKTSSVSGFHTGSPSRTSRGMRGSQRHTR